MPRIVPLQLLKCLKVLLDDRGGILSVTEVKRIAGLMTKYSKKLVSKCIYVLILKATKTELLVEFMEVGGWSLVYTWLNDAIRAMNWPLVQEILELLLLCPVDVHRLKGNSAPKLVKSLSRDGGNEGVRILAKRLVDQWLKIVRASEKEARNKELMRSDTTGITEASNQGNCNEQTGVIESQKTAITTKAASIMEQDPLADVDNMSTNSLSFTPTIAQKKASEKGLVYKIVVKDGHQVLAKVSKTKSQYNQIYEDDSVDIVQNYGETTVDAVGEDEVTTSEIVEDEEGDSSMQKPEKGSESSSADEETSVPTEEANATADQKKVVSESKDLIGTDKENNEKGAAKDSLDSKSSKERKSDKDRDHKSPSSHKSSSSSHKSSSKSSSSSSKSKSSHRSSSDKHRSDKDRSSSSSSSKDREKERSKDKNKDHKEGGSSSSLSNQKSTSKSSSSSSSKDRHRDKDKKSSSSTSSPTTITPTSTKDKDPSLDKDSVQVKPLQATLDKLGKIPKKTKVDTDTDANKPTSITIPSKKASMSIEIRRDTEKAKTVKTYKSQFRSHGLTEEAPPPPSRKDLKKPGTSSSTTTSGLAIPTTFTPALKRPSPPPRETPAEKKPKIDINAVKIANEKPGAIKLIPPPKKIVQTLIETNMFSDALSAATGPKKVVKRKRPATPSASKDGVTSPVSSDAPKVAPLKFYQDTLDESKTEDKEKQEKSKDKDAIVDDEDVDKENTEDDDDIPLKRVKEDIEKKVLLAQKEEGPVEILSESEDKQKDPNSNEAIASGEPKKPGPGCGPNGPPGVLMLHRRTGPKKKLTWMPQEQLENIRYFEVDETERINVMKTSFNDMKNLERFRERDAFNMARRGFNHEDKMQPQTPWRKMIVVDDVPPHPDGSQSKQRKIQADRELSTLRALYFSHSMIPDSPAEAELEPHFAYDIPIIPLDDITGNPDAVNDFTSMPWPEAKGSPKHGDNALAGTGGLNGLSGPTDMFNNVISPNTANPFTPYMSPFNNGPTINNIPPTHSMTNAGPQTVWSVPPTNGVMPMMGNPYVGAKPNMDMSVPPQFNRQVGHFGNNGPPFGPQFVPNGYNNGQNFGPMGPNVPMAHTQPPMNLGVGGMMNGPVRGNNRNNSGNNNWRNNNNGNYNDNGGNGGNTWRGSNNGPNRGGGNMNNSNNGVCKAFIRGHCRLGKACKYIHPKTKRI